MGRSDLIGKMIREDFQMVLDYFNIMYFGGKPFFTLDNTFIKNPSFVTNLAYFAKPLGLNNVAIALIEQIADQMFVCTRKVGDKMVDFVLLLFEDMTMLNQLAPLFVNLKVLLNYMAQINHIHVQYLQEKAKAKLKSKAMAQGTAKDSSGHEDVLSDKVKAEEPVRIKNRLMPQDLQDLSWLDGKLIPVLPLVLNTSGMKYTGPVDLAGIFSLFKSNPLPEQKVLFELNGLPLFPIEVLDPYELSEEMIFKAESVNAQCELIALKAYADGSDALKAAYEKYKHVFDLADERLYGRYDLDYDQTDDPSKKTEDDMNQTRTEFSEIFTGFYKERIRREAEAEKADAIKKAVAEIEEKNRIEKENDKQKMIQNYMKQFNCSFETAKNIITSLLV